jgi:hypothetical protein
VSDKFYNPVQVPEVLVTPAAEADFVRLYARDGEAYALFPNGEEKLLTGTNPVTPGTDRDISFADAPEISDTFSTQFVFADTSAASDAPVYGLVLDDSASASDVVNGATLAAISNDSLAATDVAGSSLAFDAEDTAAMSDVIVTAVRMPEGSAISDPRQDALINLQNWAGTIESNTNFLSPANAIDLDEVSICFLNAQQTAISGSVTTTGEITLSMRPYAITPTPATTSVKLIWGWQTGSSGTLQNGNSVDVDVQYSLDDGSTFVTIQTISTTINAAVDVETTITASYADLQMLQFKLVGSVTCGTALTVNARQFCGIRFTRAELDFTQTL